MKRALVVLTVAGLFACEITARGLREDVEPPVDLDDASADGGLDGGKRTASVPKSTATPSPCPTIRLDAPTAAKVVGAPAASARLWLAWQPDALQVIVDVTDPLIEGTDPTEPYDNDSIEIYVSSNAARTGDYGPTERHYIIDHKGLAIDYSDLSAPVAMSNVSVAMTTGGYRVEMKVVASSAFGFPLFASQTLYFDVLLNDGISQANYLVWATEPHATCPLCIECACNLSPAYDTLLFSPITLQ